MRTHLAFGITEPPEKENYFI